MTSNNKPSLFIVYETFNFFCMHLANVSCIFVEIWKQGPTNDKCVDWTDLLHEFRALNGYFMHKQDSQLE